MRRGIPPFPRSLSYSSIVSKEPANEVVDVFFLHAVLIAYGPKDPVDADNFLSTLIWTKLKLGCNMGRTGELLNKLNMGFDEGVHLSNS